MIRVLIVDDNPNNLYLLRALLQGHGYVVDEARHGAEALTKAREALPDLIISDLLMPVMDGYTLLRLWKADERLKTIPFVVYTATYTEPKDERLALDLGADAFMIKPVEPEQFRAFIQEVLAKKAGGELSSHRAPEGHEVGLLKEYSEVLIHKLEQKVIQLEQANRALEQEIALRRQAETELRESENRFRRIYDDAPVMMHSIDKDLIVRNVNRKWLETLGYDRSEIIGAGIESIMTPGSRATLRNVIELFWAIGEANEIPYEYVKKDGAVLSVLLDAISWDDPLWGKVSLTVLRDVTQLRILQKQLFQAQKMEAIGTLAGGIAHDFNNILQVGLGYSEFLLLDKELPERYRPDLTKIHESARRGADLVRGLLTFSRKTEIELQPLNLNSRINELQKMIERTIPKMINIQICLAEDLAAINANPTQVDQILMNLVVNARDAMPDGGNLTIETANFTFDEEYTKTHFDVKRGRYVRVMVTDSGTGMDNDTLEHIFEPFYTTKGIGEGTGLGLSMVHGIMKQHGGLIMCYSEPGQGTTFKIYFPALISDEEKEEAGERKMPRGGSETILLVDDEEFIRELGARLLTKAGYNVIKASNGKEALGVYQTRSEEIAVVILDLIMPEMGGKQCLEGLLGLDPSIKVIIASGYSADGPGKEAVAAGAKGFVNKPYDHRQILEVIRSILDKE
ncbi:MAG: response regulator [Deltaproteobacteria bacterium]|nr:response regulator [Deltaproteobacteria bacterium]